MFGLSRNRSKKAFVPAGKRGNAQETRGAIMNAMRSAIVAGFAAAALFLGPSLAQAAQGFIVDQTELKAGPDDQFPTVVEVQAGAEVNVFGCLSGNTWCDVSFQDERGWISGQDL